jgi:hypothetical protein
VTPVAAVRRLTPEERVAFVHVPALDRARARVVVVAWLAPGTTGMTIGRWVLLRRGHERDRDLLAHELVHVRQWREQGARRFLTSYVGDYLTARWRGAGHWDAYRSIPLEAEARALAGSRPRE